MADFLSRDPRDPQFWDERFNKKFIPWDKGSVPQDLQLFVQSLTSPLGTLIPGCGNGYEAAFLAQAGWNVSAIDFSPAAVISAREAIGVWEQHVIEADFFAYRPEHTLELIYERAFFCALPPAMRTAIVARWTELLAPGGLLVGFFYFDDALDASLKGPPFSINSQTWQALISPYFIQLEDRPVADSISVFAGKERWQVWRRI